MAEIKRRTLTLSTGKQIKLFGNSIGISKSLEIGEGYMPNILSTNPDNDPKGEPQLVNNPYKLTLEEVMELADFMMQLWLQLKENIRKNGLDNPRIFSREATK